MVSTLVFIPPGPTIEQCYIYAWKADRNARLLTGPERQDMQGEAMAWRAAAFVRIQDLVRAAVAEERSRRDALRSSESNA
ncbi:hypothetical protein [Brevundimonas sp.]|uniref:hypothetical protein n=1 Tax=Brevundimonas sp. TaxID=1871086 RepID=UPI003BAA7982